MSFKNIVGNGAFARIEQMHLFLQCFQENTTHAVKLLPSNSSNVFVVVES